MLRENCADILLVVQTELLANIMLATDNPTQEEQFSVCLQKPNAVREADDPLIAYEFLERTGVS
jgi:hypothetical protein